jgi:DNA helicase HerA-like ATPase
MDNSASKNFVGTVVGVTNPREFYFSITPGRVRLQELVAIDAYRIDEAGEKQDQTDRVWAKITEIERINPLFPEEAAQELAYQRMSAFDTVISLSREMITAKCRVLGLEDENGELQPLTYPLQPASSVYIPPKDEVEKLVSVNVEGHRRLSIGHLRSRETFKVYVDGHSIVARHLGVLAATGAGKTVAVRKIVEELIQKNYPILIFDPHSDYIGLKDVFDRKVVVYYPMIYLSQEHDSEVIAYIAGLSGETPSAPQENLIKGLLDLYRSGQSFIDRVIRPHAQREYNLNLETHHFYALLELLTTLQTLSEGDEWRSSVLPEMKRVSGRVDQNLNTSGNPVSRMLYKAADAYRSMKSANRFGRTDQIPVPKPSEIGKLVESGKTSILNLEGYTDEIRQSIIASLVKKLLDLRVESKIKRFLTVIEESHTVIPAASEGKVVPSLPVLKQVATEGRKYGMGLILISQRPSRVDSTILSQCNSFLILKIINPADQAYVRQVIESIGEDDARILPDLATGEALITGECVRFPILAKIEMPKSKGRHEEEDFIKEFTG